MIFLVIVLAVLALIHGYVGLRIIPTLGLSMPWSVLIWSLIAILALLSIAGPLLRFQGIENRFTDILSWIDYTSLGFFVLMLVVIAARDLGWGIWLGSTKVAGWVSGFFGRDAAPAAVDPGKRQFVITAMNLGLLSLTGGYTAYGFFQARRRPEVIEVNAPI